jgi:hypothetical protein
MLLDGNQVRGTISQLPTEELYCCVDGEELIGCHFDLDSAERTLRDAVTFKDIERATADAEWAAVTAAVEPAVTEDDGPNRFFRGLGMGLLLAGAIWAGAAYITAAVALAGIQAMIP